LNKESLTSIIQFLSEGFASKGVNFNLPTSLLCLIFCEGFFGNIGSEDTSIEQMAKGDLPVLECEDILAEFIETVDFVSLATTASNEILTLEGVLQNLRDMLFVDFYDEGKELEKLGKDFIMRYNAGRNTLLRGIPRFLRVFKPKIV
jgi:hypothetical protein